jgi:hypothetical protein
MTSTIRSPDSTNDTEAEALLFYLAAALLRLPYEGRTRALHIRALELKRRVGQWGLTVPSDDERRSTRESLVELCFEAAQWRELLR